MSSGCGDVLSLADLQTAKKHQLFEAEVITGKQGGVAGGADIDYATNQVTGQTQKTLPAVLRDAGFRPAPFTFATGGTLGVDDADIAVLWPGPSGDGQYYVWHGALPKTIPASSSPATTGGVSDTAWVPFGDITLRNELSAVDGAALVGSTNYAQIRLYTGSKTRISCLGRTVNRDGGQGAFYLDAADSTSPDDDGICLVTGSGQRWKRAYSGSKKAAWWGVVDGASVSSGLLKAINSGGKIEVQDGQYTVTTGVATDFTGASFPVLGRKSARYDLIGSSQHNTTFNTNNIDFLTYTGNDYAAPANVGQGIFSGMRWENFCVYGTNNTGRGLVLNNAINVAVRNIRVRRNRVGMALKGILVSDFYDCALDFNETGLYMTTGLNSTMNANNFTGIKFGSNYRYAVSGDAGTRVSFSGCDFENNGWDTNDTGGTDLTGNITLTVVEPLSTINFNDCYFEGNEGWADIEINNTTASPVIVNLNNCVFGRGNSRGRGCKYVFFPRSTGGGPVILNLRGCFFYTQTGGGYVAKITEPVIYAQPFLRVTGMDTCVFSQSVNMSNGVISQGQPTPVFVSSTGGITKGPQWLTCIKSSTGIYTLTSTYSLGVDINSFVVMAEPRTTGFRVDVTKNSTINMTIRVRDSAGVLTDGAFDLAILAGMWEGR